jgi:hypothetical protein
MNISAIRWIVIGVLLSLGLRQAAAQDTWLGVNGGLSISDLDGGTNPPSQGYTSRQAANFGLSAETFFNGAFSVRTEVDYVGQGAKRNGVQAINQPPPGLAIPPGQTLYAKFDSETILNYLEVPLMAKYTWGSSFQYFAEAGVYVGYLITAKTESSGSSLVYVDSKGTVATVGGQPLAPVSFNDSVSVKANFADLNWGGTAGVGIAYLLNEDNRVTLTFRFEDGIPSLQRNTALDGKNHTGAVLLTLGYEFKL